MQANKSTASTADQAPALAPGVSVVDVEAVGLELDSALATGDQAWAAVMLQRVRESLRQMRIETDPNDEAEPRLSLRVWVALCAYAMHSPGDVLDRATNPAELLTPILFCGYWRPNQPSYPFQNHHTLSDACDWNDYAIKGWPQYPDDPEWVAMMEEEEEEEES